MEDRKTSDDILSPLLGYLHPDLGGNQSTLLVGGGFSVELRLAAASYCMANFSAVLRRKL